MKLDSVGNLTLYMQFYFDRQATITVKKFLKPTFYFKIFLKIQLFFWCNAANTSKANS